MQQPDKNSANIFSMELVMRAVHRFHTAGGILTPSEPTIPPEDRVKLRIRLVSEEVNKELIPAIEAGDMVGIADGIADSIYVLVGTALEYGIPLNVVWAAVCAANDAKIDPATGLVRKDEGGKILKPEGWTPPDIEAILRLRRTPL